MAADPEAVDFEADYGKDELFGGRGLSEPIKTIEVIN